MLKACLLFMDIMIAEVREGRFSSSVFKSVLMSRNGGSGQGNVTTRTGCPPVLPGRSSFGVGEKKI